MFRFYYQKYKLLVWVILLLLFASSVILKVSRGRIFEAYFSGVSAVISLIMIILCLVSKRKQQ